MDINNGKNWIAILTGSLAAIIIVLVDVVFFSEPQLAMPKCLLLTTCFFMLALVKFKDKAKFNTSLVIACIFLAAGIFAYSFTAINDMTAKSAAAEVIKAADNYKAKNGAYPQKLEELSPEFISAIPRAKHTVLWNNFYLIDGKLVYINTPPFNLRQYDLAERKWTWCGSATFAKILTLSGK